MISEALIAEGLLRHRGRDMERNHEDQGMRQFRLWLRGAWESSEIARGQRLAIAIQTEEAR
jgi:hypothetical protein